MREFELRIVSQSELEDKVTNWFQFVPAWTGWESIIDFLSEDPRIRPLASVISMEKQMIRGTEMGKTVHFARKRDVSIREKWEITDDNSQSVTVANKVTMDQVVAPRTALFRSLRTHSGVRTIRIDGKSDYLVVERFKGDDVLWEEWPKFNPSSRREEFWARKCSLCIVRRLNLVVPGVSLMAFTSDEPLIPSKMLWCIKGVNSADRRILSVWFNSTPFFLAMLEERTETEGSFSGWDKYVWGRVLTLDPSDLSSKERERILKTYERVSDIQFPSLLDQFSNRFEGRKIIDDAVFRVLELDEYLEEEAINGLYGKVYEQLKRLRDVSRGE